MNKQLSAENAAIQNAANNIATTSTTPAMERSNQTVTTNRRRTPSAPLWRCLAKARRSFNSLPSPLQNTDNKYLCLQEAAHGIYSDIIRVDYDVANEARKLTNLIDFGEYCNELRLNPKNVAQHVVFEGKTVMRRVMEYGVSATLGTKIQMFNEPLVSTKDVKLLTSTETQNTEA